MLPTTQESISFIADDLHYSFEISNVKFQENYEIMDVELIDKKANANLLTDCNDFHTVLT